MLVNSGNAHSFVSPRMLHKVGFSSKPISITITSREKMISKVHITRLEWEISGHRFTSDMKVMEIALYKMLFGDD